MAEKITESKQEKAVLILGASEEARYGISLAHELGLRVVAFDGNEKAPGLPLADEVHVADIMDASAITRLLPSAPAAVLPVPIGRALVSTGAVNDFYALKGVSQAAALVCTDKYDFHVKLAAHGLRQAQCVLLTKNIRPEQIKPFFPVILKPRFGSGSRQVTFINSPEALQQELAKEAFKQEDFVCESCVPGQEYGLDGAVLDGVFYPILLRRKEITPPPYRQCTGYYAVVPEEQPVLYDKAARLMRRAVQILGINNALLHADLIDTGEDFFIIELSPRPSGHHLHNGFTIAATGVNMLKEYIEHVVFKREAYFAPQTVKHTLISYFNFENCTLSRLPEETYLKNKYPLKAYFCYLCPGEKMQPIANGHTLMKRGYYILQAQSDEKLQELRDQLLQEFEVTYE